MHGCRLALTAMMLAFLKAEAQVETQHALDGNLPLRPGLDLVLHARIRTQPGRLGFYQIRGGPVLECAAAGGFRLIAGYYYAEQENSEADFIGGHRWFGGGEGRLWRSGTARMDARLVAERFLPAQGNDFSRYRLRIRLRGTGTLAPYGSIENFLDARGWRSTRYAGGIRLKGGPAVSFDAGYFVEPRRADVGHLRHMFLTGIEVNFGTKQLPDLDR